MDEDDGDDYDVDMDDLSERAAERQRVRGSRLHRPRSLLRLPFTL